MPPPELVLNHVRGDRAHGTAQQGPQLALAQLMSYQSAGAAAQQRRAEPPLAIRRLAVRVAVVRRGGGIRVCGMRAR